MEDDQRNEDVTNMPDDPLLSVGNSKVTQKKSVSRRNRRVGCKKEITTEQKTIYTKAFLVWALFTLGGWLSIPNEYLPLFSHCVGFGFFLTITTRRTRWLGALALGGLIFSGLMYFSMPTEWFSMASNSAGYIAMGFALVLAYLCTFVTPQSIKEGVTKNEYYLKGSRYLEEMTKSLAMVSPGQAQEGVRRQEDGKAMPSDPKERQLQILESAPREGLCVIIRQLNARLIARDEEMAKFKDSTTGRIKRLLTQIDSEVEKRLRLETTIARQEEHIKNLTEQLQQEHSKHIMPVVALEKQLKESQEMQKRLADDLVRVQNDSKQAMEKRIAIESELAVLKDRKEKAEVESQMAMEEKAKLEKKVIQLASTKNKLEKQIQEFNVSTKGKLEKQAQEERESKKQTELTLTAQLKALAEDHNTQIRKLKEEAGGEIKRRHKQTIEIAEKAESLIRKQQDKITHLETDLLKLNEERKSHRKLCSNLIGGVLSESDLRRLTPRQLELLQNELKVGLLKLNAIIGPEDESGPKTRKRAGSDISDSPRRRRGSIATRESRRSIHLHDASKSTPPSPLLSATSPHIESLETRQPSKDSESQTIRKPSRIVGRDEGVHQLTSVLMNSLFSSPSASPSVSPIPSPRPLLQWDGLYTSSPPSPPSPTVSSTLSPSNIQPPSIALSDSTLLGEQEESSANCRICRSHPIDAALYPCGHCCVCSSCAISILDPSAKSDSPVFCPICHLPIQFWQGLEGTSLATSEMTLPQPTIVSSTLSGPGLFSSITHFLATTAQLSDASP